MTQEQELALANYVREMVEVVIPQIMITLRNRQRLAVESRKEIIA